MDEWLERWQSVSRRDVAFNNIIRFNYSNSKLLLNTFPLQTMLQNPRAPDNPECVSNTIESAKDIIAIVHQFSVRGVLRYCPDVSSLVSSFINVCVKVFADGGCV
jgi:hypothetical protein